MNRRSGAFTTWNINGGNRNLVANYARWPCWSPDGATIAYPGKHYTPPEIATGTKLADAKRTNHWIAITRDGLSNKEPGWVPVIKKTK